MSQNSRVREEAVIARYRMMSYILLSQLFLRSPRVEFLRELMKSLKNIGEGEDTPRELITIKRILEEADNIEDLSLELRKEYTRLFLGVKPGYSPPPPYESVYRGEKRLYGRYTLDVLRHYARWGFDPKKALDYNGPPDHYGVELAFMAYLCRLEEEAWVKNDAKMLREVISEEKRFFNEHLYAWTRDLLDKLHKWARTDFYKAVIGLVERLVEEEKKYLESLGANID